MRTPLTFDYRSGPLFRWPSWLIPTKGMILACVALVSAGFLALTALIIGKTVAAFAPEYAVPVTSLLLVLSGMMAGFWLRGVGE